MRIIRQYLIISFLLISCSLSETSVDGELVDDEIEFVSGKILNKIEFYSSNGEYHSSSVFEYDQAGRIYRRTSLESDHYAEYNYNGGSVTIYNSRFDRYTYYNKESENVYRTRVGNSGGYSISTYNNDCGIVREENYSQNGTNTYLTEYEYTDENCSCTKRTYLMNDPDNPNFLLQTQYITYDNNNLWNMSTLLPFEKFPKQGNILEKRTYIRWPEEQSTTVTSRNFSYEYDSDGYPIKSINEDGDYTLFYYY